MNRSEMKCYLKGRTCPFCGGHLTGYHPRDEKGRMRPMTYICTHCGRNPWDALTGPPTQPEGEKAMSRKKLTATFPKPATTGRVHTIAKPRTKPVTKGHPPIEDEDPAPPAQTSDRLEEMMADGTLRPYTPPADTAEPDGDGEGPAPETRDETPKKKPRTPKAKPTAPDETPQELCTFAFRLTPAERDEIHAAAGKGSASKFVKAMVLAVARGDMNPVQEAVDRIHAR